MYTIRYEKNEELNTLIYTLGAGVGPDFDYKESNYCKVIIMTDADDDGIYTYSDSIINILLSLYASTLRAGDDIYRLTSTL